ncbi:MAG: cation diffusion facilitator family transporter [Candidatus Zhuqueibacterota bacterium]
MADENKTIRLGIVTVILNVALMAVKIATGILGNSYALIADGIESATDIFTSLITWVGFQLSLRPPDSKHPFGHGKIESLAGIFSGLALFFAAGMIGYHSMREILTPHHSPEWFTLPVLIGVVITKELLSRRIQSVAGQLDSRALEGDAWHHRSDALTSGAAAIGIAIALIGGPGLSMADDWAALLACTIIVINGSRIISRSLHDTMDGSIDPAFAESIRAQAVSIERVARAEKCLVRKSGTRYFVELHIQVDGGLSVATGHEIGHRVKAHLLKYFPKLQDVVIHLEPSEVHIDPGSDSDA